MAAAPPFSSWYHPSLPHSFLGELIFFGGVVIRWWNFLLSGILGHSRSNNSAVFGLNVLIDEFLVVVYKYLLYPLELHSSVWNSDECRCE